MQDKKFPNNQQTPPKIITNMVGICNTILEQLNNRIENKTKTEDNNITIQLWSEDDTVISILNKLATIITKIGHDNLMQQEQKGALSTLNKIEIDIIMDFCKNTYKKNKWKSKKEKGNMQQSLILENRV